MDGITTMKMALAALSLAALGGSIAPALAEVTEESLAPTAVTASDAAELPRFVPSPEAAEAGFARARGSSIETPGVKCPSGPTRR